MAKTSNQITDAMIEAFLQKKKDEEAKAKAKAKAEKTATKANRVFRTNAYAQKAWPNRMLHLCKVIGGQKFDEGTVVECHWIGVNKFGQDTAKVVRSDGKPFLKDGKDIGWMNPKFLSEGKPLSAARQAAIEAERGGESDEMILLPASVRRENDKSVLLDYSGWFGSTWFPKTLVTRVGETPDGLTIFEVPAWKVRKDKGGDSLAGLKAKQDELKEFIAE